MDDNPWLSLKDIKKAIVIDFFGNAFFLCIYILLSGPDWYQEMGLFREYPLALIIIVACGFALALAAALLTNEEEP